MEIPSVEMNNGVTIPRTGFGTWKLAEGGEAENAVTQALKAGYRLIDTARIYGNESSVGSAIRQSGLSRREIFVTTKLWPQDFGYHEGLRAFDSSLSKLGLDYIDLYLLHWPDGPARRDAWKALQEIFKQERARAIGVSNFMVEHLQEFLDEFETVPAVNQIEFHPFIYQKQKPVLEFCHKHDIIVEAYSPLTVGRHINHPGISAVAEETGKTNAQVILRWCVQHNTVPIPRSANPEHVKENLDIFGFELAEQQMESIDKLSDDSWAPNEM